MLGWLYVHVFFLSLLRDLLYYFDVTLSFVVCFCMFFWGKIYLNLLNLFESSLFPDQKSIQEKLKIVSIVTKMYCGSREKKYQINSFLFTIQLMYSWEILFWIDRYRGLSIKQQCIPLSDLLCTQWSLLKYAANFAVVDLKETLFYYINLR